MNSWVCLAKRSQSGPGYLLSLFVLAVHLSSHLAQISIHPHRNIFQAPNTTWFHSLLHSFSYCLFSPWYILPLCWPTNTWRRIPVHTRRYTHASWHSSRHILCENLSGPFTLFPLAFVYGWFIYVVLSLVQYQFHRKQDLSCIHLLSPRF